MVMQDQSGIGNCLRKMVAWSWCLEQDQEARVWSWAKMKVNLEAIARTC
jgi:hypothetical protein